MSDQFRKHNAGAEKGPVHRIVKTGAFDLRSYMENCGEQFPKIRPAVKHYISSAADNKALPNPLFDPAFYLDANEDVARSRIDPFMHYALMGEKEGRLPHRVFSVDFVRRELEKDEFLEARRICGADGLSTVLGKFTAMARAGFFIKPNPFFDVNFVLDAMGEEAKTHMHPLLAWLEKGEPAGVDPSPLFDVKAYADRYRAGRRAGSLAFHMVKGIQLGNDTTPGRDAARPTVFAQVKYFTQPGDEHEAEPLGAQGTAPSLHVLAYYLPQFHADPVNDAAWGAGYTEWTALHKALPRFRGHYQPRVPGAFGAYDLSRPGIMQRQASAARRAGITAFAFYYYDLGGEKPLRAPVERFLETPEIDIDFCYIWANESWSRTWDGREDDLILLQDYSDRQISNVVQDAARAMADPRYLRVNGRPLFIVYRALGMPNPQRILRKLRSDLNAASGENVLLFSALTSALPNFSNVPIDGLIEFPPHEYFNQLATQHIGPQSIFDEAFAGRVTDYDQLVTLSLSRDYGRAPIIPTAVPSWDNEPRRSGWPTLVHGSTPLKFENWVRALARRQLANPTIGAPMICINAWNEWAEGAYLEPDRHYGYAYLNAVARALSDLK